MAQLESAAALDRLPFTTTRNLVVVLIETGLRGGDARGLAFSPTLDDSAGWPCLRFEATKVRAEQLIPLSAKATAAIRAQQDHVLRHWPAGSPWLFPGITGNDDGAQAYSHRTFAQQLAHWQHVIDPRDQAGQPVTVTGHQFRHTLGTRLKRRGVASNATIREKREDARPALQLPRRSRERARSVSNAAVTWDVITGLHQAKEC
jgi:integrase